MRRPRPSGWPRRVRPWPCRRRTRRRVKMRPPSSNAWQASTSRAARTAGWAGGGPSRYCTRPRAAATARPFNAEGRRDSTAHQHCGSPCLSLSMRRCSRACLRARRHRQRAASGSATRLAPNIHTHSGQHGEQLRRVNAPRASQTPPLNLTFPKSTAGHHRAAVQSNEVYPPPLASARRVSFGWASDKRFPLCR